MTKVLPIFKTEYDLAEALAAGNVQAQKWFYEKNAPKLLAICNRYIADAMAAEDVMVEGIFKIFKKINSFEFKGSFDGWVKRLMVNEALMYLRANKIEFVDITDINAPVYYVETDVSLEADEILEMIKSLPSGFRTVFNLYAIEGLSHAEIAKMLGISEGTSKSQLSRARVLLQEKIKSKGLKL